jgi:hypothetical protein
MAAPRTVRAAGDVARQPAPTISPRYGQPCACKHLDVFHDIGKAGRTRCLTAGPEGPCGCAHFTPATPAQETSS